MTFVKCFFFTTMKLGIATFTRVYYFLLQYNLRAWLGSLGYGCQIQLRP